MELTLKNVERVLVEAIEDRKMDFEGACALYHKMAAGPEPWDWARIDRAVIARFGPAALLTIKANLPAGVHVPELAGV